VVEEWLRKSFFPFFLHQLRQSESHTDTPVALRVCVGASGTRHTNRVALTRPHKGEDSRFFLSRHYTCKALTAEGGCATRAINFSKIKANAARGWVRWP